VVHNIKESLMDSIKENGYIRWKGFLLTIGSALSMGGVVLLTMFLYMDSKMSDMNNKMLSKDQFNEFSKHITTSLADIKNGLHKPH
jgi:hypothetical protein